MNNEEPSASLLVTGLFVIHLYRAKPVHEMKRSEIEGVHGSISRAREEAKHPRFITMTMEAKIVHGSSLISFTLFGFGL